MKPLFTALVFTIASLAVACSGSGTEDPTAVVSPSPAATEHPAQDESTPAPTATLIPLETPEPDGTPTSETESVNHYLRAYSLIGAGEYVEAERQFNTVVQLEPNFAHGWDGIGQALILQGEFEEAMYYLDRAIELRPTLASAYGHRALARVNLDDPSGALRDAKQAQRLDEEGIDAYIVMGRVLAVRGDLSQALANFDRAIEIAPDDGGTYWWRGRFWRDIVNDFDAALADFDRAIELEPAVATIYLDRAILRINAQRDIDLIRADLEEAISLAQEPRLPTILERANELLDLINQVDPQGAASSS